MRFPDFTEEKDGRVLLYFAVKNETPQAVQSELERSYPCYFAIKPVKKDLQSYICLEIESGD